MSWKFAFVMCAIGFGFAVASASASEVCFKDIASYESVKSELPQALQSYPLYAVNQSFELTGAFEIVADRSYLQIQAHVDPIVGDVINQNDDITEACLSGDDLQVTLSSGETQTITVNSDSLTIEGHDFDITDQTTYEKVAADVPAN
jgi:hypothetical protein